jgi:hypothetical protein
MLGLAGRKVHVDTADQRGAIPDAAVGVDEDRVDRRGRGERRLRQHLVGEVGHEQAELLPRLVGHDRSGVPTKVRISGNAFPKAGG